MNETLDVRRTLGALRRRWQWLVACGMGGALLGLVLALVQKPVYLAASSVLLPPSPVNDEGKPLRSIDTEARIAASAEIFVPVTKEATPWLSVADLRRKVRVRALSTDILEVRAEESSPHRAVVLADAVARQYVAYSNGTASGQASSTISVLQREADDLDARIRQLESDIAAGIARLASLEQRSPEAARQAALVDSLRNASVDAARQLALVKSKISEARLDAELSSRGTRVLQPAITPQGPLRPRRALNVAGGAGVGFLLGAVIVLVLYSRDRRLRSRDSIAEAAGAPVVGSLNVPARSGVRVCRSLVERWEPSTTESLVLRRAFSAMGLAGTSSPMNLVVQSLPGDLAGPRVAMQCAIYAAAMGTSTEFVLATQHPTTADLRVVINSVSGGETRPHLVAYSMGGDEAPQITNADLRITAVVVDGEDVVSPTGGRPAVTALAVSAGFATSETVARVAMATLDAGHPLAGVLVANPDPADRTTGRSGSPLALLAPISPLGEGSDEVPAGMISDSVNGHRDADGPIESPVTGAIGTSPLEATSSESLTRKEPETPTPSVSRLSLAPQHQTVDDAAVAANGPTPLRVQPPSPPPDAVDDARVRSPRSERATGENARGPEGE